ncbi:Serine/Arginine-related protein 53, partial [Stegodyphus mimosarum]
MSGKDKPVSEAIVELTIDQQVKRAQAIEDINASSFVQQDFKSSRSWGKTKHEVPSDGSNNVELEASVVQTSVTVDDSWKNNPEKLVHPQLSINLDKKKEQWKEKLASMRKQLLDP